MTIIDTHAHLDHLEGLPEALKAAAEAGVEGIVAVGVDLAANKKNLEIKRNTRSPKIYVAFGLHPEKSNLAEMDECEKFIRENIREAVAIGEIGLDYWYPWVKKDPAKKEEQKKVFRRQLDLAKEFNLPAVIHSRGAWRDCLDMTKEAGVKKAVFHWYSGPVDVLQDIIYHGYFVSTTPSVAYSPQSREAIAHAPIQKTLIETDCPVYFREGEGGFQAQPKDVVRTLNAYAELKKIKPEDALKTLNRNAKEFFNIDDQ